MRRAQVWALLAEAFTAELLPALRHSWDHLEAAPRRKHRRLGISPTFNGIFHGDLLGIQWDLNRTFTMDWAFDGIYTIFMGFNCELLVISLGFIVLHGDFHGILRELNGFHSHGGTQKWVVHKGKSQSKMDDDWWYPYFRKPAYQTNIGCMSILMGDDGRIGILNHQTCEHNHGI